MSCAPVWMMRLILGTLDYYVPRVIRSNTVEQFVGVVHEVIGPHASPRLPRNSFIVVNVRYPLLSLSPCRRRSRKPWSVRARNPWFLVLDHLCLKPGQSDLELARPFELVRPQSTACARLDFQVQILHLPLAAIPLPIGRFADGGSIQLCIQFLCMRHVNAFPPHPWMVLVNRIRSMS